MPEPGTTTDTEDRRPTKTEEVWIAIGPFSRVGKWVVYGGVILVALLSLGIWWELRGIHLEVMRTRVGQELRGTTPKGG